MITTLDTHYGEDDDGAGNIDTVEKLVLASGKHLVTLAADASTGTVPGSSLTYLGHARISCPFHAEAQIADTSPYGTDSDMDAGFGYELAPDNREVNLQRDGARQVRQIHYAKWTNLRRVG